jgi:hypothetical protein
VPLHSIDQPSSFLRRQWIVFQGQENWLINELASAFSYFPILSGSVLALALYLRWNRDMRIPLPLCSNIGLVVYFDL